MWTTVRLTLTVRGGRPGRTALAAHVAVVCRSVDPPSVLSSPRVDGSATCRDDAVPSVKVSVVIAVILLLGSKLV